MAAAEEGEEDADCESPTFSLMSLSSDTHFIVALPPLPRPRPSSTTRQRPPRTALGIGGPDQCAGDGRRRRRDSPDVSPPIGGPAPWKAVGLTKVEMMGEGTRIFVFEGRGRPGRVGLGQVFFFFRSGLLSATWPRGLVEFFFL